MYPSRVRTARSLSASRNICLGGMHAWGGVVRAWWVCMPGGGVCAWGVRVTDAPPPLWTNRHLWKHNLRKLPLRAVKRTLAITATKCLPKDTRMSLNNKATNTTACTHWWLDLYRFLARWEVRQDAGFFYALDTWICVKVSHGLSVYQCAFPALHVMRSNAV